MEIFEHERVFIKKITRLSFSFQNLGSKKTSHKLMEYFPLCNQSKGSLELELTYRRNFNDIFYTLQVLDYKL